MFVKKGGAVDIDPEELLDIHQAARLLGVSATSLRRWTNSGALPHVRIGGKRERRFRRGDLLALLEPAPGRPGAPRGGREESGLPGFLVDGKPAAPGTHLCGLSMGGPGRAVQAAGFVAESLRVGSICFVVAPPPARRRLMAELARRVSGLDRHIRARRLLRSDYGPSGRAHLDYLETALTRATEAGAKSLSVLGDLSAGGPERGKPFARILEYEAEYERRIARGFPVVTLCQYDARRLSGGELLGALQAHADVLRYSARTLLGPGE